MEIYINAIYLAFENEKEAKNSKIKGRITDIIITLKNELSGCITNCRAGKRRCQMQIKMNMKGRRTSKELKKKAVN